MKTSVKRSRNLYFLAWLLLTVISSCREDEALAPDTDAATKDSTDKANRTVNDWIYENMNIYYYWNDKIPKEPDFTLAPTLFFDTLLYRYDAAAQPDGDRYSYIVENGEDLYAYNFGVEKTTGVELRLFLLSESTKEVAAQVLYVLPDSPAEKAGIQRNDFITKVNGQTINERNYIELLFGQETYTYTIATLETSGQGNSLQETGTKQATAVNFQENPILLDTVYVKGNYKVGYLVYNQFLPGRYTGNNEETDNSFDAQLDQIFAQFKAGGINELVLDLRYNPGGYSTSALTLGSLIGKNINSTQVFARSQYNRTLQPELEREYGLDFGTYRFENKAANVGGSIPKLYVLVSEYTASASEMLINGLRPYMEVTLIGMQTYGKNVGSITITDETRQVKWGMQPIVARTYNSLGQSDYTAGFAPSIRTEEPLELLPLGDADELLLATALQRITGADWTARSGRQAARQRVTTLASTLRRKAERKNILLGRLFKIQ